jgi:Flp pilus assembly protein TadD
MAEGHLDGAPSEIRAKMRFQSVISPTWLRAARRRTRGWIGVWLWAAAHTTLAPMLLNAISAHAAEPVDFVGSSICGGCHAAQKALWSTSHHALAMQKPTGVTVLGNFTNAQFEHFGVTTTFSRVGDKFMVRTDGPDGSLHDYEIAYTFGVYPLQQYLIEFPDGRIQALSVAWDARAKSAGGQRWFHLYPNEAIPHDDPLHWTGLYQNWNFSCAECHSTDVHKNYDATTNRYRTTWSEIDVACEACHGAASRHVAWARHENTDPDKGFTVAFKERAEATWTIDPATGNARRSTLQPLRTELETCGRCHSRRAELSEDWRPGQSLSSTHLVSLIERHLYRADGQIDDEVYEYGSFRQSKMFAKGVTCSDCHDQHSLELRASGDGVCLQCHAAGKYETAEHNFHGQVSPPVACISCHMPTKTYMVVHVRHDHSFRIPRPDRTVSLGIPNVCNGCHQDKSPEWAAAAIGHRFGAVRKGFQNFVDALHAARSESLAAPDLLHRTLTEPQTPGIAVATAYAESAHYLNPTLIADLRRGLSDGDPLIRLGALRGLEGVAPDQGWALAGRLLSDPVLAVRVEATSLLAAVPTASLSADDRQRFERATQEYVEVQRLAADRPEGRVTLGAFFAQRGQTDEAEAEYRAAMKLAPRSIPAYVNLADLYRGLGRDKEGEKVLREALALAPADAAVHYALGLLLVRRHDMQEATAMLAKAAELDPQRAHYAYVYAIALNSAGQHDEARGLLEANHTKHPADRETLRGLVSLANDAGDGQAAAHWAELLARLNASEPSETR